MGRGGQSQAILALTPSQKRAIAVRRFKFAACDAFKKSFVCPNTYDVA